MPVFNPEVLAHLVHEIPDRAGMTAKELASKVGKPYSTLARELNPHDDGAKLGLDTFFYILAVTGDREALDYIEGHLGRVAYEIPPANTDTEVIMADKVARMTRKTGVWLQRASEVMAGEKVTPEQARRLIAKGHKIISLLARVEAHLKEKVLAEG